MNDRQKAFKAYWIWAEVYGVSEIKLKTLSQFAEWLGDPMGPHREPAQADTIINVYNPAVMEKINKILGPHGRTLLKAMKAQDDGQA